MSERKTFTVRLKPGLVKEIRMLSVQKDIPFSDLLEEALNDLMKKHGTSVKKTVLKKK